MAEGSAVPTASKGSWGSFLKVLQRRLLRIFLDLTH
jgi:hypothetical protein